MFDQHAIKSEIKLITNTTTNNNNNNQQSSTTGAQLCTKDGCACSKNYVSEDVSTQLEIQLYDHYGNNLRDYTLADITKIKYELQKAEMFKSEVNIDNIMDFFNNASDKAMTLGSSFKTQLYHLSSMVEVLSDPILAESLKFDTRKLADVTSQVVIALKLLANEPTMTNMILIFTSCVSKMGLPLDKMKKYIEFIKTALQVCIASISSVGFKSENALTEMVNTFTNICGEMTNLVDDKVVDIVLTFLAKCVAFWTTLSGGFADEQLDISSVPKIVDKMREIIKSGGDVIEGLLGGYQWMIENFPKFYKGEFDGLWFGKDETRVFEARVSKCKKVYPLICSGSWDIIKEEYGYTETSYAIEVGNLIRSAHNMMKTAKPSQMPGFKRCLDELREVQVNQAMKKAQIQAKMTAIGICYVGPSGVGKSLLMEQTSKCLISASGDVPTSDKIVTGQMSDKFDSNELPQHLSIQYDDVGNNSSNENFDKLLNAVNSQSRPFLKAGVDEKGTMFPGNVACVISTNVPGLNAHKSNCPDSIARRFLHIEVKIKESLIDEICVPGTKRVDAVKATTQDGEPRMDIWKFNVYEFITFDLPTDQDEFPEGCIIWENMLVRPLQWTKKVEEEQTFWDLIMFLTKRAKRHYASQEKALASMKMRQNIGYCGECHLPENVCMCCKEMESEWFVNYELGNRIHSIAGAYDNLMWLRDDVLNITRWQQGVGAVLMLAPLKWKVRIINYGLPTFTLLTLLSNTALLTVCVTIIVLVFMYVCEVYIAFRSARHCLATTQGAISQLAEDTCAAARRHRNTIFAGASMIGFIYLLYRAFRPRSEMISYQESLPVNVKSALARRERAKTTPLDQILPHIKKDIGKLTVTIDGESSRHCLAFPIESNFYVTVGHVFPKEGDFTIEIKHDDSLTPTAAKQKLTTNHIYRFDNKDLVIFQVPSAAPRRGYKDFLVGRPSHLGTQYVKLVTLDMPSMTRQVSDTRMEPAFNMFKNNVFVDNAQGGLKVYQPYKYASPIGTRNGMCGSVVVDYAQSVIYGFHIAGTGKVGLMTTLTMQDVEGALNKFRGFVPLNKGELQMGSQTLVKEPGMCDMQIGDDEHDKSLEDHNCITEGILPEGGAKFSSPYIKHPFIQEVTKEFGPYKFGPPQEINSNFHKRKALTKLTTPNQEFALDELDYIVDDFMRPVKKMIVNLPKSKKEDLSRTLSVQEALDGTGEPSLGGINNSTSCGFPFKGKKKNYLKRDPFDEDLPLTPRELVEYRDVNIMEEVEEMKARYLSGVSCRPLFKCSMKTNELLPVEKKKARIFMGSNFPFLILCRQYLAPVIRLISKNKFLFETAKGMNMDSVEAEQLYEFIRVQEGERVVALDYSAYDQTMSAQLTTSVAGMVVDMLKDLGCSNEHIQVARGLLTDIVYPNLHFFGTIIQLANSDPSGNPITTELNGMVNSLYLRCFFFRIYPELKGKMNYRDAIKTMTYGDDNISGVHSDYEKFNGENIVAEGKKVGLKITMADKDAEITKFTHINDSDFLKRKFRYCEDLGRMRAPLAKSSITKSLYWMKKDSPEPPEILFAQNVDGGLRKASQYGRGYFEEMRTKFKTIAEVHGCENLIKWWGYDELILHDRFQYYDNHVYHHVHPSYYGDIDEIKGFISEAKKKPKMNAFDRFIIAAYFTLIGGYVSVTLCRQLGIEDDVKEVLLRLVRMPGQLRGELEEKFEEAYTLNGWQGVLEVAGLPTFLVPFMMKMMNRLNTNSEGPDNFKSEYFVEEKQDQVLPRSRALNLLHEIMDTVMSLKSFVNTGRSFELGLSQTGFVAALVSCVMAKSYLGVKKEDGLITTGLSILTKEAKRLIADTCLRMNNQLVRKQAFCIFLEGDPGCGKTFATITIAKTIFPDLNKHQMIVLNEEDEFQSELRSYHKVIMMDDVGNRNINREVDNPLRRPLDFVNNTPRRSLNPEADLKGLISVEPELVIMTSNVSAQTLASYHSEVPESLYRRWLRVNLVKKSDFTQGFDMDKWEFRVYELQPTIPGKTETKYRGNKGYGKEYMAMNTEEFLTYIIEQYKNHMSLQDELVQGVNNFFHTKSLLQRGYDYAKSLWTPLKFKSESYERHQRILDGLEEMLPDLNRGNFVEMVREVANSVDIDMSVELAEMTIPQKTWWESVLDFFGFQPHFVSEALARYKNISEMSERQQRAIVQCAGFGSGCIITPDYVTTSCFSRVYPFNQKGYNILMKMVVDHGKCIIPDLMDEFYPADQIAQWAREIKEHWHLNIMILEDLADQAPVSDLTGNLNFKSESLIDEEEDRDEFRREVLTIMAEDKGFVVHFLEQHLDSAMMDHYRYVMTHYDVFASLKDGGCLERLHLNEHGYMDDTSLQTEDGFAYNDRKGFNRSPLMGKVGECPSFAESHAQYKGHMVFRAKFPGRRLVARELTIGKASCDLIYYSDLNKEYYLLECKRNDIGTAGTQADRRYKQLEKEFPVKESWAYVEVGNILEQII